MIGARAPRGLLAVLLVALSACRGGDPPAPTGRAAACARMTEDAAAVIAAFAASPSAALPPLDHPDRRIDVALVDSGAGDFGGVVRFVAPTAGDYAFYLDSALVLEITDARGVILSARRTDVVPDCSEVAVEHVVPLPAGDVYLSFSRATNPTLGLVQQAAPR